MKELFDSETLFIILMLYWMFKYFRLKDEYKRIVKDLINDRLDLEEGR